MQATYLQKRWQTTQWNNVRTSAGPRYTAEIDVELPIRGLFEGLGRTDVFFKDIKNLNNQLKEETKKIDKRGRRYKYNVQRRLPKICKYSMAISKTLRGIANDTSLELPFKEIPPKTKLIFQHIRAIQDITYEREEAERREYEEKQKAKAEELPDQNSEIPARISHHQDSDYLSSLKFLREDLRKLSSALREIEDISTGVKAKLANEPFVLLLGEAGMGKTHLLCDVTKDRLSNDYKTIVILGEEIPQISSPIKTILKAKNISGTESSFLKEINSYGERKRRRVLLVVDAINESDVKGWKKNLHRLKKQMCKYPWVGVVLSCRTPFENIIIPQRMKINKEYHRGFDDYEFEAMKAFFRHYRIPLPEVPVLISEFSSPLFLSSFCKTAVDLRGGRRKVAKKVKDISLGQKGMTTILEDFYIAKQANIYKKHQNEFGGIITQDWLWDKTSGEECVIKFFAKTMANKQQEFLLLDDAITSLIQFFDDNQTQEVCKNILDLLVQNGVVIKDLAYIPGDSGYKEVIKFPFHKFSDHLIARYLLENHLKVRQLKKSLSPDSPLGELFKDEDTLYRNANLAEAIIVEFTERIKRNKKAHNKEIVDYINKTITRSHAFREIYINALYWRRPDNFQNKNGQIRSSIIDYFNSTLLGYKDSTKNLLDLFITTAVKPKHPLSYLALSNWLNGMTMPTRDIFWTEYLRNSYESDPIYRLINWIEEHDITKISEAHASAVITTVSWFLTTTSHLLRNRATRCIYLIGSIQPKVCFEQTLKTLSVNDPYISERMLGASYGIAMRFSYESNKETNHFIKDVSEKIYKNFLSNSPKYATTHVYSRDYARGIVELALYKRLISLKKSEIANLRPPYTKGGIRHWGESDDQNEGEYRDGNSPLGMDFTNYTLGKLIDNRRNYDFGNNEYKKVKSNILWRIYELGYSLKTFGEIDKQIVSSQRMTRSDYPTKVDRYGKKYSWIAYYELLGHRSDKKLINSFWGGDNYRESENDIDPSFPLLDDMKHPIHTNLLGGPQKMDTWLSHAPKPNLDQYKKINIKSSKDDWILVEGSIGQLNEATAKRNSIFINGLFVCNTEKGELKKFLKSTEYLGNDLIPDIPKVRSEYLAELGWHPDYSKAEGILEAKFPNGYKRVKLSKKEKLVQAIRLMSFDEEELPLRLPHEQKEYREKPLYKKFKIRRPARYCSSKDYSHLGTDDELGLFIPSNSVIKNLNLHKERDTFNFLDGDGNLATISFLEGSPYKTHKNLLYIRKDLLEKIKKKYNKDFFVCAWGERQYWPRDLNFIHREKYAETYQERKNLHRQIFQT